MDTFNLATFQIKRLPKFAEVRLVTTVLPAQNTGSLAPNIDLWSSCTPIIHNHAHDYNYQIRPTFFASITVAWRGLEIVVPFRLNLINSDRWLIFTPLLNGWIYVQQIRKVKCSNQSFNLPRLAIPQHPEHSRSRWTSVRYAIQNLNCWQTEIKLEPHKKLHLNIDLILWLIIDDGKLRVASIGTRFK